MLGHGPIEHDLADIVVHLEQHGDHARRLHDLHRIGRHHDARHPVRDAVGRRVGEGRVAHHRGEPGVKALGSGGGEGRLLVVLGPHDLAYPRGHLGRRRRGADDVIAVHGRHVADEPDAGNVVRIGRGRAQGRLIGGGGRSGQAQDRQGRRQSGRAARRVAASGVKPSSLKHDVFSRLGVLTALPGVSTGNRVADNRHSPKAAGFSPYQLACSPIMKARGCEGVTVCGSGLAGRGLGLILTVPSVPK